MTPLETRTDSPGETHIQRNPVSAWQLEMKDPILLSQESFFGVPLASQEQALSIGKARGTPGSCHHSQSPPDVLVHSRETCFPCTASTFKPGSTHTMVARGTALWESLVGKPRGKATDPLIHSMGSVTLLLQLGRKAHVHAPARDKD